MASFVAVTSHPCCRGPSAGSLTAALHVTVTHRVCDSITVWLCLLNLGRKCLLRVCRCSMICKTNSYTNRHSARLLGVSTAWPRYLPRAMLPYHRVLFLRCYRVCPGKHWQASGDFCSVFHVWGPESSLSWHVKEDPLTVAMALWGSQGRV